jgi:hypothetical protein
VSDYVTLLSANKKANNSVVEKSKPGENQGRKVTGLSLVKQARYDSRTAQQTVKLKLPGQSSGPFLIPSGSASVTLKSLQKKTTHSVSEIVA